MNAARLIGTDFETEIHGAKLCVLGKCVRRVESPPGSVRCEASPPPQVRRLGRACSDASGAHRRRGRGRLVVVPVPTSKSSRHRLLRVCGGIFTHKSSTLSLFLLYGSSRTKIPRAACMTGRPCWTPTESSSTRSPSSARSPTSSAARPAAPATGHCPVDVVSTPPENAWVSSILYCS